MKPESVHIFTFPFLGIRPEIQKQILLFKSPQAPFNSTLLFVELN